MIRKEVAGLVVYAINHIDLLVKSANTNIRQRFTIEKR